jgi:predicted nucleotidyltransferase
MPRAIPSFMDAKSVARIDARLGAVRREHAVAMPLAIESGSRAWGFPSPDSDFDCRFIFVRGREDYLSLFAGRDVIETPLEGELDVNGWDVAKSIKLLLKGNAVVIEWLTSPIIYASDAWFADTFLALARDIANRGAIARHYLHLGERQRRTYFADGNNVPLKKMFYALRPAAALRWLRMRPGEAIAPMHFPTLLAECDASRVVIELAAELIARKAVTRELGEGPLPVPIADFIDREFARARDTFDGAAPGVMPEARARAQAFFLDVLSKFAP